MAERNDTGQPRLQAAVDEPAVDRGVPEMQNITLLQSKEEPSIDDVPTVDTSDKNLVIAKIIDDIEAYQQRKRVEVSQDGILNLVWLHQQLGGEVFLQFQQEVLIRRQSEADSKLQSLNEGIYENDRAKVGAILNADHSVVAYIGW